MNKEKRVMWNLNKIITSSSRFSLMSDVYVQLINLPTLYKLARTMEHLLCSTSVVTSFFPIEFFRKPS